MRGEVIGTTYTLITPAGAFRRQLPGKNAPAFRPLENSRSNPESCLKVISQTAPREQLTSPSSLTIDTAKSSGG